MQTIRKQTACAAIKKCQTKDEVVNRVIDAVEYD